MRIALHVWVVLSFLPFALDTKPAFADESQSHSVSTEISQPSCSQSLVTTTKQKKRAFGLNLRVLATASASLLVYVGVSTAAQTWMPNLAGTGFVAILTALALPTVDALWGPLFEATIPILKRKQFANANLAQDRLSERTDFQDRHLDIYMLGQAMVTSPEGYGRTTEAEMISRLLGALMNCSLDSASCEKSRRDSVRLIAKVLAHLRKQYREINLLEEEYVEWADVFFARLEMDYEQRRQFAEEVLQKIGSKYDKSILSKPEEKKRYTDILRAWLLLDAPPPGELPFGDGHGI